MKSEIEGTYPSGELQGDLINELEEELREAKQKLGSLITELERLDERRFNAGTIVNVDLQYFISSGDIKALIDKYKGGE
jgi:hypothetical protein